MEFHYNNLVDTLIACNPSTQPLHATLLRNHCIQPCYATIACNPATQPLHATLLRNHCMQPCYATIACNPATQLLRSCVATPLCRETHSLGQQLLNTPVGINGLSYYFGVHFLPDHFTPQRFFRLFCGLAGETAP